MLGKIHKSPLIIFILLFIILGGIKFYNVRRFHLEKQKRFMMDTYVTIYALGPERITSEAVNQALNRMQEIEIKFNPRDSRSPVFRFNQQGTPISDPEVLEVVKIALKVSRDSEGAFDITTFPLTVLWKVTDKSPDIPGQDQIEEVLSRVGYQHLLLENGVLNKKQDDVSIDLGGIAKGYAVSEAVKVLRNYGVASAVIDAGGDVFVLGRRGRKGWKVGIRDPHKDDILGYLEVEDLAVMGSGVYERFFVKGEKKYHHIINPKTGYPAEGPSGVTVVYSDPVIADAWATAIFVMGSSKGLERVEEFPGMEAIIVSEAGEVLYSQGIKDALRIIPKGQ
ncbi:MAG: FAD:protein FMN transferase [Candidatus Omnitrophota bacterium]